MSDEKPSSNVVGMRGYSVPAPRGEPVPGVVDMLRDVLERAQRGEIVAAGIAYVIDDGTPVYSVGRELCGTARPHANYALCAAIARLSKLWLEFVYV